jgi:hypothetical protein
MLVEMPFPLPLETAVTVRFGSPREGGEADEIVAHAQVKHHYCLNFMAPGGDGEPASTRAIGLRFLAFESEVPEERLLDGWTRDLLLH